MSSRAGLYTVKRREFLWIVPALLKWHLVSTYICFCNGISILKLDSDYEFAT